MRGRATRTHARTEILVCFVVHFCRWPLDQSVGGIFIFLKNFFLFLLLLWKVGFVLSFGFFNFNFLKNSSCCAAFLSCWKFACCESRVVACWQKLRFRAAAATERERSRGWCVVFRGGRIGSIWGMCQFAGSPPLKL